MLSEDNLILKTASHEIGAEIFHSGVGTTLAHVGDSQKVTYR